MSELWIYAKLKERIFFFAKLEFTKSVQVQNSIEIDYTIKVATGQATDVSWMAIWTIIEQNILMRQNS